jgi:hypothetical protein
LLKNSVAFLQREVIVTPSTDTTNHMNATATTSAAARQIILANVKDWDSEVLDIAVAAAIAGESAYDFEARPEDEKEMRAFARAFRQIQEA